MRKVLAGTLETSAMSVLGTLLAACADLFFHLGLFQMAKAATVLLALLALLDGIRFAARRLMTR